MSVLRAWLMPSEQKEGASPTSSAEGSTVGDAPLDWVTQHEQARRALLSKGGIPGLARADQVSGMSGLDVLQAMMEGRLPYPSMNDTMDLLLLEVQAGRVVFQGIPSMDHFNPMGTVHGGWFASLLDSALGCAVHSTLPAGRSYTTAELSINIVRAASLKTGALRAEGVVLHSGRQIATAQASVLDEGGKLYAHATTTCVVFDMA